VILRPKGALAVSPSCPVAHSNLMKTIHTKEAAKWRRRENRTLLNGRMNCSGGTRTTTTAGLPLGGKERLLFFQFHVVLVSLGCERRRSTNALILIFSRPSSTLGGMRVRESEVEQRRRTQSNKLSSHIHFCARRISKRAGVLCFTGRH